MSFCNHFAPARPRSALAAVAGGALAQDFPNRPIKMVIAFPPGGPTDFVGTPARRQGEGRCSARASSSRTRRAPTARSARTPSPSPIPMATRCSSPPSARSRSRRNMRTDLPYDPVTRLRAGHAGGAQHRRCWWCGRTSRSRSAKELARSRRRSPDTIPFASTGIGSHAASGARALPVRRPA